MSSAASSEATAPGYVPQVVKPALELAGSPRTIRRVQQAVHRVRSPRDATCRKRTVDRWTWRRETGVAIVSTIWLFFDASLDCGGMNYWAICEEFPRPSERAHEDDCARGHRVRDRDVFRRSRRRKAATAATSLGEAWRHGDARYTLGSALDVEQRTPAGSRNRRPCHTSDALHCNAAAHEIHRRGPVEPPLERQRPLMQQERKAACGLRPGLACGGEQRGRLAVPSVHGVEYPHSREPTWHAGRQR